MKNYISLLVFILLVSTLSFSQNRTCGADIILKKNLQENPEKIIVRNQLENHTKEFIKNYQNTAKMGQQYIIPVVVHVIHDYGVENISDEQIARAMETVNEDWNGENNDIEDVIEEFSDLVASFGIEFRLATIDPDGNCTYGITRTASPLTEGNDEAARGLISWPDENYVNVYVIKSMSPGSSAAAYANYPGAGDPYDLIVSRHDYFGHGVGTAGSSNYVRHTISHEFGHFMNLAHPWGSTNEPGVQENCGTDDGVEDTPNTIGTNQSCDVYQETCGSLDNVQNIMDYANCAHMFTEGQKQRVHAALNSMAGNRESLWQPENLILTGVDAEHFNSNETYMTCAPIPDFNTTTNTGCQGTEIEFISHSYNSENIVYSWDFGTGANPQYSAEANPTVSYQEKGSHNVSLTVCSGNDNSYCNEITRENYIYILDDVSVASDVGIGQDFAPSENGSFPENDGWYIVPQNNEDTWETTTSAAWNDDTSIRIRSRYFGYELNSHTFTTPELDLSNLSSAQIYFNLAYALKSTQTDFEDNLYIQDQLVIYTSDNCGETWMARKTYNVDDLITVFDEFGNPLTIFNDFIPTGDQENPGDWIQKTFSLNNVAGDEGVIIKFEFTGIGMTEDGINVGGNWLYIDNLRVGENFVNLIEEASVELHIFPNPSDGSANIEINLTSSEKIFIELYNVVGKAVAIKEFDLQKGVNILKIEDIHTDIPTGNYLINVITNKEKLSNSIIITK